MLAALGVGLVALLILGFYLFDWTSSIGIELTVATLALLAALIGGFFVRWQVEGDNGLGQLALVIVVPLLIGLVLGWNSEELEDERAAERPPTSTTEPADTTTTEAPMTDAEETEFFERLDVCFTSDIEFAYDAGYDEGYEDGRAVAEGLSIRPPPDDYAPDGTPLSPRARFMRALMDRATWPCSATPPSPVEGADLDRIVLFRQLEHCYNDGVSDAYSAGYEDGYSAGEAGAQGIGAAMDEAERSESLAELHDVAAFPCG